VDSKGKGFRTIALGSMPRFLCCPKDLILIMDDKLKGMVNE